MTDRIVLDKDGVQRELTLPFSIWIKKEDMDHMARRIYETLHLWSAHGVEEGWFDVYAIDRGRTVASPIGWSRAATIAPVEDADQSEITHIVDLEADDADPDDDNDNGGEEREVAGTIR